MTTPDPQLARALAIIGRRREAGRAAAERQLVLAITEMQAALTNLRGGESGSCVTRLRNVTHYIAQVISDASRHHAECEAHETYLSVLASELAQDAGSIGASNTGAPDEQ